MDITTYIYKAEENKQFIVKLLKSRQDQDYLIGTRLAKIENYIGHNNPLFGIGQGKLDNVKDPIDTKVDGILDSIPETWTEQMVQNLIANHSLTKYKLRNKWFQYPTNPETSYVCSGMAEFGILRYRIVNGESVPYFHTGLDIGSATDTEVVSASTGIVSQVGYDKDGGNFVIVETVVDGVVYHICYFHIEEIQVKERTVILQGARIGIMGQTGELQTGRHLHFEVRKDGIRVNPVINSSFNKIVVARI
jgi:murein DD-endopeptidase MepM/ murein hydrolase activator NlpD